MKKLVLILNLLIVETIVLGQTESTFPTNYDGIIEYSGVVQAPELTKDQLYDKCLIWFAEQFKSANDVLQYKDKESGTIIGKGVFVEGSYNAKWLFTLKIEFRDGRFKYNMNNIYLEHGSEGYPFERLAFPTSYKKMSIKRARKIEAQNIKPFIASLQQITLGDKDDTDW